MEIIYGNRIMNSNLHKPKEQLHLLWPQNYCCHWYFSHLFISFCVLSSAARKFTLQTRLLRILLTLFSQHYCLKCVYSELAKFLPSTYLSNVFSNLFENRYFSSIVKVRIVWGLQLQLFQATLHQYDQVPPSMRTWWDDHFTKSWWTGRSSNYCTGCLKKNWV